MVAQRSAYHVQEALNTPNEFGHHQSIGALWDVKWRPLACAGVYPFMDADVEDFEPIFSKMIRENGNDRSILWNANEYAKYFLPVARSLIDQARSKEKGGDTDEAKRLYLRAGAVCRIARFPINRPDHPMSQEAWRLNKVAYMAASAYLPTPNAEILLPYIYASTVAGESSDSVIPIYLRVPKADRPPSGWPTIIFICGLDAYRTEFTHLVSNWNRRGYACISVEIPGTGDSPAARADPTSADRQWSSVLDWMEESTNNYGFDMARIVVHGLSTGGYYAMRMAHTHSARLRGVVAHGGGCHHMFDEQWISAMNHMEYPFALAESLAYKFGYDTAEEFALSSKSRFSLVEDGTFDLPCTRLLLINGIQDSIFPIEDSLLPLRYGRPKEARILSNREHMGFPEADTIITDWIQMICMS